MKLFEADSPVVKLIDSQGTFRGEISSEKAIAESKEAGYDLVVVNDGEIPVVKMVDYGKEKFRQQKAERLAFARVRASRIETKEIRLRPVTDHNDLMIKARKTNEFLKEGSHVRVVMTFKGREQNNKQVGINLFQEFLMLIDNFVQDQYNESEKSISVLLKPSK